MATKLLIVEDETTLRETLAYNLTQEGYPVTQSGDGADPPSSFTYSRNGKLCLG
jgi:DNA-binding response OmpR family regulator